MASGIYVIENSITGHRYVGSARRLDERRRQHFNDLRANRHHSVILQRAFDKHGEGALQFRTLLLCDVENLLFYEQRAMDVYQPEYNVLRFAGSRLGYKLTGEALARHTERMRTRPMTEAMRRHLADLAERMRGKPGRPLTPEAIEKIRAARAKQVITEEHKARISAACTGRRHTAEAKAKIAAAKRGKKRAPFSEEHRAKLGEALRGRVYSAQTREKIAAARRGRPLSDAHRAAITEGHRRRRERLAQEQLSAAHQES